MSDERPLNPGSREAREAGCVCPVLDNGHGDFDWAKARGGWVIFTDCPLHGRPFGGDGGLSPVDDQGGESRGA